MADAPDLGSGIVRCRGSSPLLRMINYFPSESENRERRK